MEMKISGMAEEKRTRFLNEALLSMNVGFAIAYSLFAYGANFYLPTFAPIPVQSFLRAFDHWFLRIAPLVVSVSPEMHRRSIFMWEFGFVIVTLGLAAIVFGFWKMLAHTRIAGFVVDPLPGITALLAVPGCWLYLIEITRPGPQFQQGLWTSYGLFFAVEMCVAGILVCVVKSRGLWLGGLVFICHYALWIYVIGRVSGIPSLSSILLSVVFPLSGIAWLRYSRLLRTSELAGA